MGNLYPHGFLVAFQDIALNGDVAELSCAVEALDVACRTDVNAPAVVEELVAANKNITHEVVAVEASPCIAIGEIVEDANVAGTLNADAVTPSVLNNVASDDLSLAFGHRLTSIHTIPEARLVFHENAVVAAIYTDAVRYDEVLILVASQSYAYAAASALAFRPQATTLYHAYIIYIYTIEEVNTKGCGWSAAKDKVVKDSIRQRADVESLAVGDIVLGLHIVGINREMLEAHTLDGREVALLCAFADEERPVRRANHLEDGALHRDTLQTNLRTPLYRGTENILACGKLNGAAALSMDFIYKSLQALRIVPHLGGYKIIRCLINGSMKLTDEEQKEQKPSTSSLKIIMPNVQCPVVLGANLRLFCDIGKRKAKEFALLA